MRKNILEKQLSFITREEELQELIKDLIGIIPQIRNNSVLYGFERFFFKDTIKTEKDINYFDSNKQYLYDDILEKFNYYRVNQLVAANVKINKVAPLFNQMYSENTHLHVLYLQLFSQTLMQKAFTDTHFYNGALEVKAKNNFYVAQEVYKKYIYNPFVEDYENMDELLKKDKLLVENTFENFKKDKIQHQTINVFNSLLMGAIADVEIPIPQTNKTYATKIPILFNIEEFFLYINNDINQITKILSLYQRTLVEYNILPNMEYANKLLDINQNPFFKNIYTNIVLKAQDQLKYNLMPFTFTKKDKTVIPNNREMDFEKYINLNPFLTQIKKFNKIAVDKRKRIQLGEVIIDEYNLEKLLPLYDISEKDNLLNVPSWNENYATPLRKVDLEAIDLRIRDI